MFDVLDDLEDAVGKLLASEPSGDDVERLSVLSERLECARLREVAAFDRSCVAVGPVGPQARVVVRGGCGVRCW